MSEGSYDAHRMCASLRVKNAKVRAWPLSACDTCAVFLEMGANLARRKRRYSIHSGVAACPSHSASPSINSAGGSLLGATSKDSPYVPQLLPVINFFGGEPFFPSIRRRQLSFLESENSLVLYPR